jgi:hypothetical protein
MNRKIKIILIALVAMALILGGLNLSLSRGLAKEEVQVSANKTTDAQAASPVYLPMVINMYKLPTIFGAEVSAITHNGGVDELSATRAYFVRRNAINWATVEQVKGQRDWSTLAGLETELINASNNGLQVILIVRGTPTWAQLIPGSECGPITRDSFSAFASFMNAAVARYSQPPYNVHYWEVLNEPDLPRFYGSTPYGCWGDATDRYYGGGYYADMMKQVYPQIKAADPKSQVLIGGLLLDCDPNNPPIIPPSTTPKDCSISNFFEGILVNGGGNYFDGVSFHAYDYYESPGVFDNINWHSAYNTTGPVANAKVAFLENLLNNYHVYGKWLINTETALLCESSSQVCDNDFETTKVQFLAQSYALALSQGLRGNIWYGFTGGWRNSGLINNNLTEKPGFTAYTFSRSMLLDSQFTQEDTEYSGVKVLVYDRGDYYIWVVWSQDGNQHTITLPAVPEAAYDAMGDEMTQTQVVDVGTTPFYLMWPK